MIIDKFENGAIIRKMQKDDLNEVTKVHLEAFTCNRSSLLGKNFVNAEYEWFINNHPDLSMVFIRNHKILGFITGATPNYPSRIAISLKKIVLISLITRPWLLMNPIIWNGMLSYLKYYINQKLLKLNNRVQNKSIDTDTEMIIRLASIAVDSQFRGQGIATRLINSFEKQASNEGVEKLGLSVQADNYAACRSYEKSGWQLAYKRKETIVYEKVLITNGELTTHIYSTTS